MKTVVLAVMLVLAGLLAVACGRQTATPAPAGTFSVYLLGEDLPTARLADLPVGSLPLKEPPVISGDDVVAYDRVTHEIELAPEAYERVRALFTTAVRVDGLPFVAGVGRERIYAGAFWTPLSSLTYGGVYILQPFASEPPVIRLDRGYPGPEAAQGEDPRPDPRLMAALRSAGKLLPAGPSPAALDIFSGRPNPEWELSAAETDTLSNLLAGLAPTAPTGLSQPLGYRGFVVRWPGAADLWVTMTAYGGLVEIQASTILTYADPDRTVERWLLETARPTVDAQILATVEAELAR